MKLHSLTLGRVGLAAVFIGLVAITLSCRREYKKPDVENLAGEGAKSLTPFLVVYKTSAVTFDLCDKDGVGLIDGGLVGLAQVDRNLYVATYVPVKSLPENLDKLDQAEVRSALVEVDSTGRLKTSGVRLLPAGATSFFANGKEVDLPAYTPIRKWWNGQSLAVVVPTAD
jgi:hypothetical protein